MNKLTSKVVTISIIVIALLFGIGMIKILIDERISYKDKVHDDIARSSVKSQIFAGPMIAVPYVIKTYDAEKNLYKRQPSIAYFFPEQLNIEGDLSTEERYRGIYKTNVYTFKGQLAGQFNLPKNFGFTDTQQSYEIGQPFIALRMTDIRGIGNSTEILLNQKKIALSPLSDKGYLAEGVKGDLSAVDLQNGGSFKFAITLELMGTSALNFVSAGKETTVQLTGQWPHPSFTGNVLPKERSVESKSFSAVWEVNQFSNITPKILENCWQSNGQCQTYNVMSFGVDLVDPVDHYRKSDRAVKYAILFIGLTFAGFFVFEIVRQMKIHSMQYALVGIALVLFFLLLISLSEHIGFFWAYCIAALSCIGLITYYMHGLLQDKKLSIGFASVLTLLYIILYILLNGEEYSLLLGSVLLFAAIGATMMLTKNIDWYALSQSPQKLKTKAVEEVTDEN